MFPPTVRAVKSHAIHASDGGFPPSGKVLAATCCAPSRRRWRAEARGPRDGRVELGADHARSVGGAIVIPLNACGHIDAVLVDCRALVVAHALGAVVVVPAQLRAGDRDQVGERQPGPRREAAAAILAGPCDVPLAIEHATGRRVGRQRVATGVDSAVRHESPVDHRLAALARTARHDKYQERDQSTHAPESHEGQRETLVISGQRIPHAVRWVARDRADHVSRAARCG
jgi:hypothetical protein